MPLGKKARGEHPHHTISWDELDIAPAIQIKEGILRRLYNLEREETGHRNQLKYSNELVALEGQWKDFSDYGSELSFRLKNISGSSLRIARLIFPTENGLDDFISDFDPQTLSFLRNGYQSWSTARSYRRKEKPLRPWLTIISLASSNLANLPSNVPGILSSDMYSCIKDKKKGESFFIGQGPPFDQFFYIRLNLHRSERAKSYFEVVYDFGRKLLKPGATIALDSIFVAKAKTENLLTLYFETIKKTLKLKTLGKHIRGWCSWYYYYNRIKPQDILANLNVIKEKNLPIDLVQIDDGYARAVGDWLTLTPEFEGKMKMLADSIRDAGYIPGIWIAPFIADKKSDIVKYRPEFLLRNEHGKRIMAGYNVFWPGHFYYGLDITNPQFEEYIRKVIRTIVHEWGYTYLKCDFLFGGCLRGGTHKDLSLSRAEVLKRGMNIIREEAGKDAVIVGCGMPLSPGIGTVDTMRIGPDTGPFWIKRIIKLLRTGAMVGVRNSVRNILVRSPMHKRIWLNDPDCLMLRRRNTKLNEDERMFQINAIILSGGPLLLSDDLTKIDNHELERYHKIAELSAACASGEPEVPDIMEREVPQVCYNTAGYVGIFNGSDDKKEISFEVESGRIEDVWNGEVFTGTNGEITLKEIPPHSSRLFRIR